MKGSFISRTTTVVCCGTAGVRKGGHVSLSVFPRSSLTSPQATADSLLPYHHHHPSFPSFSPSSPLCFSRPLTMAATTDTTDDNLYDGSVSSLAIHALLSSHSHIVLVCPLFQVCTATTSKRTSLFRQRNPPAALTPPLSPSQTTTSPARPRLRLRKSPCRPRRRLRIQHRLELAR